MWFPSIPGLGRSRSRTARLTRTASCRLFVELLEDRTLPSFLAPVSYPAGNGGGGLVAVADVDNDGTPDLIVPNYTDGTVSVFLGNANGTFQPARTSATGPSPYLLAVGDFNGDGKLDIVTANNTVGGSMNLLLGNGDGTFQPPRTIATGTTPDSMVVGDVNGDGKLDIVLGRPSWNYPEQYDVSVLLGNGDGTFRSPILSPMPFAYGVPDEIPISIALGDFNRDGKLDLVVADDYAGGPVQLLLGKGDGTFQAPMNVFSSSSFIPLSVAVGALTTTGNLDLVITGQVASSTGSFGEVVALPGRGNGTFGTPFLLRVGTFSQLGGARRLQP